MISGTSHFNIPSEEMPLILKRPGKFQISWKVIEKCPDIVLQLFSKIIIARAESYLTRHALSYEGYSFLFDEVEEGGAISEYEIDFNGIEMEIKKIPIRGADIRKVIIRKRGDDGNVEFNRSDKDE